MMENLPPKARNAAHPQERQHSAAVAPLRFRDSRKTLDQKFEGFVEVDYFPTSDFASRGNLTTRLDLSASPQRKRVWGDRHGSLYDQLGWKPAIRLSRKDWHFGASRAVVWLSSARWHSLVPGSWPAGFIASAGLRW